MKSIAIFIVLTFLTTDIFACDCSPWTLEQHYKKADIIFYAKVTGINDKSREGYRDTFYFIIDSLYTLKGGYHPELKILKIVKGHFPKGLLKNDKLDFNTRWSNCDIYFTRDSEYVIFGYYDENGTLGTSMCTPTTIVTDKTFIRRLEKLR